MTTTIVDRPQPAHNLNLLLRAANAAPDMAVALARLGQAVLPLIPGAKTPATGAGVHDASADPATAEATFAAVPGANVGMVPGSSLIVIDADTPEQVNAFRAWAAETTGDTDWLVDDCTPPTVVTPGTADGGHHGGGHWYCVVPPEMADTAAALPGKTVLPGGAVAMTGDGCYVVAPPSVRPEGAYQATGMVLDAGAGLLDALVAMRDAARDARNRVRAEARDEDTDDRDEAIDAWEVATPWADLLGPAGWVEHGTDSCGCTTWTRPGASNPRSATAHECSDGTRLHVWSDSVDELEGGRSYSKLQTHAAFEHDGDISSALDAIAADTGEEVLARRAPVTDDDVQGLQLVPPGVGWGGPAYPPPTAPMAPAPAEIDPGVARVLEAAGAKATTTRRQEAAAVIRLYGGDIDAACGAVEGGGPALLAATAAEATRRRARAIADDAEGTGTTVDLDAVGAVAADDDAFWAALTAAAPVPTAYGLVYRNGLHLLAGAPGCGKTWLSLAVLRSMADASMAYPSLAPAPGARRPVVYVDADGNGKAALLRRLMQLGATPDDVRPGGGIRVVSLPDVAAEESCAMEAALRAVVAAAEKDNARALVLDTMSRAIVAMGGDSNSSDSVTAVLNLLAPLAENAAVIVLDHVGHENKDRPSGSMAKIGAPSAVLMMEKMRRNADEYPGTAISAAISVVKDRHGGIVARTCDPEDERRAGVWVLRKTERTVDRLGVPRLDVDMIPARVSAEKRAAEAKAAEESATPVAAIIAEAADREGRPVPKGRAIKAIQAARGCSRSDAERLLDAAVETGMVDEQPNPVRSDLKVYAAA